MNKICNRCVMDSSDPDIFFDEKGFCNHCNKAISTLNSPPLVLSEKERWEILLEKVKLIKSSCLNKTHNCVIGLSGGIDSSFVAYLVLKKLGLKPLAVHLDNGWNSDTATKNIENICKRLNIDLFTYVIDWEEFKDIQLSFLRSSTPDLEIPSDHAIVSILYKVALKKGLKYIIAGTNSTSESIMPQAWSRGHHDWKYIKSIQRLFGNKKIKTFPHRSLFQYLIYKYIYKIKWFDVLDYINYDKEKAKDTIKSELGWSDYGRKHSESNYTRIYQEYILPTKFGFDKRKAHYSSLIISNQLSRVKALEMLKENLYTNTSKIEEDIEYIINKFSINRAYFDYLMKLPPKTYFDYPNYTKTKLYKNLRFIWNNHKHTIKKILNV